MRTRYVAFDLAALFVGRRGAAQGLADASCLSTSEACPETFLLQLQVQPGGRSGSEQPHDIDILNSNVPLGWMEPEDVDAYMDALRHVPDAPPLPVLRDPKEELNHQLGQEIDQNVQEAKEATQEVGEHYKARTKESILGATRSLVGGLYLGLNLIEHPVHQIAEHTRTALRNVKATFQQVRSDRERLEDNLEDFGYLLNDALQGFLATWSVFQWRVKALGNATVEQVGVLAQETGVALQFLQAAVSKNFEQAAVLADGVRYNVKAASRSVVQMARQSEVVLAKILWQAGQDLDVAIQQVDALVEAVEGAYSDIQASVLGGLAEATATNLAEGADFDRETSLLGVQTKMTRLMHVLRDSTSQFLRDIVAELMELEALLQAA